MGQFVIMFSTSQSQIHPRAQLDQASAICSGTDRMLVLVFKFTFESDNDCKIWHFVYGYARVYRAAVMTTQLVQINWQDWNHFGFHYQISQCKFVSFIQIAGPPWEQIKCSQILTTRRCISSTWSPFKLSWMKRLSPMIKMSVIGTNHADWRVYIKVSQGATRTVNRNTLNRHRVLKKSIYVHHRCEIVHWCFGQSRSVHSVHLIQVCIRFRPLFQMAFSDYSF